MKLISLIGIILMLICCSEEIEETNSEIDLTEYWSQDVSSDMNAAFSKEEDKEIESFLIRYSDWEMTQTGTGLRYYIYKHSNLGDSAVIGDLVTIDFEISLLDGTVCYASSEDGPTSFMVEKTDIESGLHEGIKFMKEGDQAKFILPSYMAHGLAGDNEKIPPLSPVIYDIKLLKVERNEPEKS